MEMRWSERGVGRAARERGRDREGEGGSGRERGMEEEEERGDRVGCRKHADTRNHIHACIYA